MIRRSYPTPADKIVVARTLTLPSTVNNIADSDVARVGWTAFLLLVSLLLIEPIVPGVT